jgi:hypothetical protein
VRVATALQPQPLGKQPAAQCLRACLRQH